MILRDCLVLICLSLWSYQVKALICDTAAGWTQLLQTDYCVKLFHSDQAATFTTALTNCRNLGGDLASIHNAFENKVINDLRTGQDVKDDQVIIGLQYDSTTKQYTWTDGSLVDYKNLVDDFEANIVYSGNCAGINAKYLWTNIDCSTDKEPYVCKKAGTQGTGTDQCPSSDLIYTDYGTIESPGYPSLYGANLGCRYTLAAKTGHNISINLDSHQLATNDAITIYDGKNVHSNVLACFNGNAVCKNGQNPAQTTFETSGHEAYITFDSQGTGTGTWKITWHSIPDDTPHTTLIPPDQCPSKTHVYLDNGVLQSPAYPNHYGANNDCIYLLAVRSQDKIKMTFTALTTNIGDYIELYDNPETVTTTLPFASTTNNQIHLNTPITSPSNEVKMVFHSGTIAQGFWRMVWNSSAECPTDVNYRQGEIRSPGYPDAYPPLKTCRYQIDTDYGYKIHLSFLEVFMDSSADIIHIYDGQYESGVPFIISGNESGAQYDSTSNHVVIVFNSGSLQQPYYRWKATFNSFL